MSLAYGFAHAESYTQASRKFQTVTMIRKMRLEVPRANGTSHDSSEVLTRIGRQQSSLSSSSDGKGGKLNCK